MSYGRRARQIGNLRWLGEEGETVDECLLRELQEEISLDIAFIKDFIVPASQDFAIDRHFFLFEATINDLDFEVYEGAEAYTAEAIKRRTDLTGNTFWANIE